MSRFFSAKYRSLAPYTPGEQPNDTNYIKLNTNESPFPPSKRAQRLANTAAKRLELYPDPECRELTEKLADTLGVNADEVLLTNGSDEILNFAFMAYCDEFHPAVFPDITYGFYSVFAQINKVPYVEMPLTEDFKINISDYLECGKTIFIANPNAPTGISLSTEEIEEILKSNPNNIVVIDEAYVDFGGTSCVPLIHEYDNLLVTQTFSKSRSMAGARLGFGVASKDLIHDLNIIKYSTNPYNINRMTTAAGLGVLEDNKYTVKNCRTIIENREFTISELKGLGFAVTDSDANFVFAKSDKIEGEELYKKLKQRGVLVRHFAKPKICEYVRITIGTKKQMQRLISCVKSILEDK